VDRLHPLREEPDRNSLNHGRDMAVYRAYMQAQVRELLSTGRQTDMLWMDYSYPTDTAKGAGKGHEDWGSDELVNLVRELAPRIMLNDRLDLRDRADAWDFTTPEQYQIQEAPRVNGQRVMFESCQTFSGSWGYFRDETTWKSLEQLLTMLVHTVSMGGNFLLNIGPDARGRIDPRAVERLKGIANWMDLHRRSIIGCGEAPAALTVPDDCRLTWNPQTRRAYLHLLAWPYRRIILKGPGWHRHLRHAQLLSDGSEIPLYRPEGEVPDFPTVAPTRAGTVELTLPVHRPSVALPVIEMILND
jgi:alpha-L-fucosidase